MSPRQLIEIERLQFHTNFFYQQLQEKRNLTNEQIICNATKLLDNQLALWVNTPASLIGYQDFEEANIHEHVRIQKPLSELLKKFISPILKENIPPTKQNELSILSVACGTCPEFGLMKDMLKGLYPHLFVKYTSIDYDPKLIQVAKKLWRKESNIEFYTIDASDSKQFERLPENSISIIMNQQFFDSKEKWKKIIINTYKHLLLDGILIITSSGLNEHNAMIQELKRSGVFQQFTPLVNMQISSECKTDPPQEVFFNEMLEKENNLNKSNLCKIPNYNFPKWTSGYNEFICILKKK
ncbi:MAG: class I SAM-dependent methyltransferase [Candidatus Caenarcaniphilales bacterium]|nr:class I SAM-dependent methyltransferase [Candidatus Caenarcaniphilales bacterium]